MELWSKEVSYKDRVLDVGCGEGRLLQDMKPAINYTGIDFSKKLIEIAKERYRGKNHNFIVGDITKRDVWKDLGKFDRVFVVAVLHHLPSKKEQLYVLKQIKKHSKKGGKIYISFWNLWQKKFLSEHFKSFRLKFQNIRWVEIPFINTNLKRFYFAGGKRYWKKILTEAGWTNVKIEFDESKKNLWAVLD